MNTSRVRQVLFLMRLEFKRQWLGRRFIGIGCLSVLPNLLMAIPVLWGGSLQIGRPPILYTEFFQIFWLHLAIFFSCAMMFSQLFRSETLEKTLHYYFLVPIRREVVVVAKYLTALVTVVTLFTVTSITSYFLFFWPSLYHRRFALSPIGIQHLGNYLLIVVFACFAYGALFLLIGLVFRNPMIPAVFILLWESFGYVLPALFQRLTISLYLQPFQPLFLSHGPFAILIPLPSRVASVIILALVTIGLLTASTVILRKTQITYSAD